MIVGTLGTLLFFLIISFVIILLGSAKSDDPKLFSMLGAKYRTTLVVVGAMVIPVFIGEIAFVLSVMVLALASQNEVIRLCLPDLAWQWRVMAIAGTLLMLGAGAAWGVNGLMAGFIFSAALFLVIFCALPEGTILWRVYAKIMASLVYPSGFLGFYLVTYKLTYGPALVLLFFCVTECNNAVAQLVGSMAGKTKIFPGISPNKTWEGVIGGACAAIVAGIVLNYTAFHFAVTHVLAGSVLIILGATAGDLVASRIKRSFGVKDFGRLLPNHGGVMDILDSVIFTAPFFFWFSGHYLTLAG
jgi:phosphatidate cytidylyltransferase